MSVTIRSEGQVAPIKDLFQVSDGSAITSDVTLPDNTRGLLVGGAAELNITINGTNYDAVPFLAGVTPGFWEKVRIGAPSVKIWAVL